MRFWLFLVSFGLLVLLSVLLLTELNSLPSATDGFIPFIMEHRVLVGAVIVDGFLLHWAMGVFNRGEKWT